MWRTLRGLEKCLKQAFGEHRQIPGLYNSQEKKCRDFKKHLLPALRLSSERKTDFCGSCSSSRNRSKAHGHRYFQVTDGWLDAINWVSRYLPGRG